LKVTETLALFHSFGKTLVSNEQLKMWSVLAVYQWSCTN